ERTGNVDIVTVALNMYMQGVDPGLDFSNIEAVRAVYERCTRMEVPPRHPYAGELVFTAFSGSHQDAIRKGMAAQDATPGALWEVPYLPIDPRDLGRSYEAIIRINSQSGKGGVAYILETDFGLQLPKAMHAEFGRVIQYQADSSGNELSSRQLFEAFEQEYLQREEPYQLEHFVVEKVGSAQETEEVSCSAHLRIDGIMREVHATGNGAVHAFEQALNQGDLASFKVISYVEHTRSEGLDTQVVTYVRIQTERDKTFFGAAIEMDSALAAANAVMSALNRSVASV